MTFSSFALVRQFVLNAMLDANFVPGFLSSIETSLIPKIEIKLFPRH
jgi:hypothetical protein